MPLKEYTSRGVLITLREYTSRRVLMPLKEDTSRRVLLIFFKCGKNVGCSCTTAPRSDAGVLMCIPWLALAPVSTVLHRKESECTPLAMKALEIIFQQGLCRGLYPSAPRLVGYTD